MREVHISMPNNTDYDGSAHISKQINPLKRAVASQVEGKYKGGRMISLGFTAATKTINHPIRRSFNGIIPRNVMESELNNPNSFIKVMASEYTKSYNSPVLYRENPYKNNVDVGSVVIMKDDLHVDEMVSSEHDFQAESRGSFDILDKIVVKDAPSPNYHLSSSETVWDDSTIKAKSKGKFDL